MASNKDRPLGYARGDELIPLIARILSRMKSRRIVLAAAFAHLAIWPAMAESGDAAKGERLFAQCKACHTVEKGGKNGIGPNLFGFLGRKAAAVAGFEYSDAMKASGVVWDEASTAGYMKDPKGFMPGNKMVFAGLKRQEQIDDMMAYLKKATQ